MGTSITMPSPLAFDNYRGYYFEFGMKERTNLFTAWLAVVSISLPKWPPFGKALVASHKKTPTNHAKKSIRHAR